jgi:hypothetical protein
MNIIKQIISQLKREAEVDPHILLGMEGMCARNEARLAKVKKQMGELYILHPAHKKSRLEEQRPV